MVIGRYFRISQIVGDPAFFGVGGLHLRAYGASLTPFVLTASAAPSSGGALSLLSDPDLTTRLYWTAAAYASLVLTWDFNAVVPVSDFRQGSYNYPGEQMTSCKLETSDDNATWRTVHNGAVPKASGNYAWATPVALREVETISGTVRDAAGVLCARIVRAYHRATGLLMDETTSDALTGQYTLYARGECCRVVLDDDTGTLYNDLIDRVIPA